MSMDTDMKCKLDEVLKELLSLYDQCVSSLQGYDVPVSVLASQISSSVQIQCFTSKDSWALDELINGMLSGDRRNGNNNKETDSGQVALISRADFISRIVAYLQNAVSQAYASDYLTEEILKCQNERIVINQKLDYSKVNNKMKSTEANNDHLERENDFSIISNNKEECYLSNGSNCMKNEDEFIGQCYLCQPTIDALEVMVKKLDSSNTALHIQLQESRDVNLALSAEKDRLEICVNEAAKRDKELDSLIAELQSTKKALENRCSSLAKRVKENEEALVQERRKNSDLELDVSRLRDKQDALDHQLTVAQRESKRLLELVEQSDQNAESYKRQFKNSASLLETCQSELFNVEERLRESQEKRSMLEEQLSSCMESLRLAKLLHEDLSSSEKEIGGRETNNGVLQHQLLRGISSDDCLDVLGSGQVDSSVTELQSRLETTLKDEMEAQGEFKCCKMGCQSPNTSSSPTKSNLEQDTLSRFEKIEERLIVIAEMVEAIAKEVKKKNSVTMVNEETNAPVPLDILAMKRLQISTYTVSTVANIECGTSLDHSGIVTPERVSFHHSICNAARALVSQAANHRCWWNVLVASGCALSTITALLVMTNSGEENDDYRPITYYSLEELLQPYVTLVWNQRPPM